MNFAQHEASSGVSSLEHGAKLRVYRPPRTVDSDLLIENIYFKSLPPELEVPLQRTRKFGGYDQGWDSYGGRAISGEAVRAAEYIIFSIFDAKKLVPLVTPTSQGGISLEYELNDCVIEFEVLGNGEIIAAVDHENYEPYEITTSLYDLYEHTGIINAFSL